MVSKALTLAVYSSPSPNLPNQFEAVWLVLTLVFEAQKLVLYHTLPHVYLLGDQNSVGWFKARHSLIMSGLFEISYHYHPYIALPFQERTLLESIFGAALQMNPVYHPSVLITTDFKQRNGAEILANWTIETSRWITYLLTRWFAIAD